MKAKELFAVAFLIIFSVFVIVEFVFITNFDEMTFKFQKTEIERFYDEPKVNGSVPYIFVEGVKNNAFS